MLGIKVGGAWRFDKADMLKWIDKQKKGSEVTYESNSS